jgi:hypothetical protein
MCLRIKFFGVICLFAIPQFVLAQQDVPTPEAPAGASRSIPSFPLPTATTTKLLQALDGPTTVDWNKTPLESALASLEKKHEIEIWIDKQAMQDAGIPTDSAIQLQLKEAPLSSCLRLMLEPLDLTFAIDREVVFITSAVAAKARMVTRTRIYPIGDLSPRSDDNKQLMDLLKCGLGLPANFNGIPPLAISGRMKTLTVRESPLTQANVAELLQAVRDAQGPDSRSMLSFPRPSPVEARIKRTLLEETSVNWSDTKLIDAMADLQKQHKINIWFDTHALAEIGGDTDQQVTLNLQKASLKSCLQLLLEPLGLVYLIERDVLVVTSQEALESKIVTCVYPVGDFCASTEDMVQLMNTFECGLGKPRSADGIWRMVASLTLKTLVVRDTVATQHKVQELILALRNAQASNPKAPD